MAKECIDSRLCSWCWSWNWACERIDMQNNKLLSGPCLCLHFFALIFHKCVLFNQHSRCSDKQAWMNWCSMHKKGVTHKENEEALYSLVAAFMCASTISFDTCLSGGLVCRLIIIYFRDRVVQLSFFFLILWCLRLSKILSRCQPKFNVFYLQVKKKLFYVRYVFVTFPNSSGCIIISEILIIIISEFIIIIISEKYIIINYNYFWNYFCVYKCDETLSLVIVFLHEAS